MNDNKIDYMQEIVAGLPDIVIAVDTNYFITVMNKTYSDFVNKMFGVIPILGAKFGTTIGKGNDEVLKIMFDGFTVALTGENKSDVYKLTQGVLANRYFETMFYPIRNKDLVIIGAVCVAKDITARKEAEERLEAAQKEEEVIIDSVPAWIFFKNKENEFIKVNKAYADSIGLKKEDVEGKSLFDMYPKEVAEEYWKDDNEVIINGKPKKNIIESTMTNRGKRWMQTDKIPYNDPKGNIVGVIGFSIDITERKESEDMLREKMAELEKFNKLFIDRENKMIELKQEIERLKQKSG